MYTRIEHPLDRVKEALGDAGFWTIEEEEGLVRIEDFEGQLIDEVRWLPETEEYHLTYIAEEFDDATQVVKAVREIVGGNKNVVL